MSKLANIYVRIDSDVKEQAETILTELGITPSDVITMFYKQIILNNGLPFEVKLSIHLLDISRMTAAEFDTELKKGYTDMHSGHTIPMEQVFADTRKDFEV